MMNITEMMSMMTGMVKAKAHIDEVTTPPCAADDYGLYDVLHPWMMQLAIRLTNKLTSNIITSLKSIVQLTGDFSKSRQRSQRKDTAFFCSMIEPGSG